MARPLRQLRHDEYTVGWVCALPVELAAAQEMLDEEHHDLECDDNDENIYALGSIGGHNIAIVCLPAGQIGNNPAAVVATQLSATFKAIRFGVMVGIAGGVPAAADIRLGDVVVSQPHQTSSGVVQYDFGKATPTGFTRTGSLNSPPRILLSAVAKVQANTLRGRSQLSTYMSKLEYLPGFQRAKAGPDVLFEASYDHEGGPMCDRCKSERLEAREPRNTTKVHYGTIASGNQVIKSAAVRDKVSTELGGVLCFEMEAAGLMNSFPCLVIRGICDYADSHKNKQWKPYAAGVAAAYAKELLLVIPPSKVEAEKTIVDVMSDLHGAAKKHQLLAEEQVDIARKQLKMQHRGREQELSIRQKECLHLFRLAKSNKDATYEWYKDRVEERVEGTCKWFLRHAHFQEWLKQDSGPLLVSADPGCGKSVLAKYLVDHILPKFATSATVCYYFFKDQDQNTIRQALCALLHQLLSRKPALIRHAVKQYKKDGKNLVNSTKSLWTILEDVVQDQQAGPIIIVLDALDECLHSDFEDLMRNIKNQSCSSQPSNSRLRYLFTSRPYEQIVAEFQDLLKSFPRIHIPGEDESKAISQEVNLVIQYRVDKFAEEKGLSDETKTCLADKLLNMEHRTYLWAYLVVDYLKDSVLKKTPKRMASAFVTLPKTVDQAYDQLLSKSKDRSKVQKALAIILSATRPLTLAEMNIAMEIDESTKWFEDLDLEQEQDFKLRLRSWCGLFVSVHCGKIYLLHQTAREFLLAKPQLPNTLFKELDWHGSITAEDAHTVLAECCVRFISFFDTCGSLSTDQLQTDSIFLEYSARFWHLHLRESKICDDGEAAIAPLTLKLSDPDAKAYAIWSKIHWKYQYVEFSTRLMVACFFGHIAVAKQSLDKGADVHALSSGQYGNALEAASGQGHIVMVKQLLNKGADVNAQSGGNYSNALTAASVGGYEAIVEQLLDKGADVNARSSVHGNALIVASEQGHEAIVKQLLDKGANVNAPGGYSSNALGAASTRGHETIVKLLLDKGAVVSSEET